MNKYVFRRLLAGIVITPLVALAYLVGYALLVGAGATASSTANEVWSNGLVFGAVLSLVFALSAIKAKGN
jgi:hypothetical protein